MKRDDWVRHASLRRCSRSHSVEAFPIQDCIAELGDGCWVDYVWLNLRWATEGLQSHLRAAEEEGRSIRRQRGRSSKVESEARVVLEAPGEPGCSEASSSSTVHLQGEDLSNKRRQQFTTVQKLTSLK
jgi:hypothetical protein